LIDVSYHLGSTNINVYWEWIGPLFIINFINPFTGTTLATYKSLFDSTHYIIPDLLSKIKISIRYAGPLSWPEYEITSPNGGEIIEGGQTYTISWWNNQFALMMDIEFSSDSGRNWSLIEDSIWNWNTSYNCEVPMIKSEKCFIRVGSYPCAYDLTDSYFTITNPVSVNNEDELPKEFSLVQNYPNPFNPSTIIRYSVPAFNVLLPGGISGGSTLVQLTVYDILGNKIATLVNENKEPGNYEVDFDTKDRNQNLTSGIYFYRLSANDFIETKKMILLR